jgi:hypothetical protein
MMCEPMEWDAAATDRQTPAVTRERGAYFIDSLEKNAA